MPVTSFRAPDGTPLRVVAIGNEVPELTGERRYLDVIAVLTSAGVDVIAACRSERS